MMPLSLCKFLAILLCDGQVLSAWFRNFALAC